MSNSFKDLFFPCPPKQLHSAAWNTAFLLPFYTRDLHENASFLKLLIKDLREAIKKSKDNIFILMKTNTDDL